jgi:hypothetical protein
MLRNPNPLIAHSQHQSLLIRSIQLDRDVHAIRRVLHGVVQQV